MKRTSILLKAAILFAAVILLSSSARESRAATFVVNSTFDIQDRINGDGACETNTARQCTLRAAITEDNATPGSDIIVLPAGTFKVFRESSCFFAGSQIKLSSPAISIK